MLLPFVVNPAGLQLPTVLNFSNQGFHFVDLLALVHVTSSTVTWFVLKRIESARVAVCPQQNSGAGSDCAIVDDYRVCRGEMPRGDIRPSVKEGIMLRSANELRGYAIAASDGNIGEVDDLYFDDQAWVMRYLAVDTGTWLPGRRVLISPISLGQPDWLAQRLPVALTKERVRNSPDIDTQKPVSRQHEADYFGYYGYPYYWGGMSMWGMGGYPGYPDDSECRARVMTAPSAEAKASQEAPDSHLRSCKAVTGHHIEATDGEIGHVADFLVDDENWAIRYLVVDTSNWWLGHQVLVAPQWITAVSWAEGKVSVNMTRQAIQDAPRYDGVAQLHRQQDRQWETGYYAHHKRLPYWSSETSASERPGPDVAGTSPTLVSLNADGGFEVAEEDRDPRGWDVEVDDGLKIGKVDDLILDTSTMKVRYLDIDIDSDQRRDGDVSDRHILLPVSLANIDGAEKVTVRVLSAADLARIPAYRSLPVAPDYEEQFVRQVRDHGARERAAAEWSIGARKTAVDRRV